MNEQERMRVAVEANMSLRTVVAWDTGKNVFLSTDKRLAEVSKKLGLLKRKGVIDPGAKRGRKDRCE